MTEPSDADPGGSTDLREVAVRHVLREVHPDRLDATAVGENWVDGRILVGVKVAPRGYFSTAKYVLVTVDPAGEVVGAETTTRGDLDRELGTNGG